MVTSMGNLKKDLRKAVDTCLKIANGVVNIINLIMMAVVLLMTLFIINGIISDLWSAWNV